MIKENWYDGISLYTTFCTICHKEAGKHNGLSARCPSDTKSSYPYSDAFLNTEFSLEPQLETPDIGQLLQKYADILDKIYKDKTVGDYTWIGVLGTFTRELEGLK